MAADLAGILPVVTSPDTPAHDAPTSRSSVLLRRTAVLLGGVVLALSAGAGSAPKASALSWTTGCHINVVNNTDYTMHVYDSYTHGAGGSKPPVEFPGDVKPHSQSDSHPFSWLSFEWLTASQLPYYNHCTVDLSWELQTADGSGWSQGLRTYVYSPNSGHNAGFATVSGDFAARTAVVASPQDHGALEDMTVTVNPPSAAAASEATAAAAKRAGEPKRLPGLLRRRDLSGRTWRHAKGIGDGGRLGKILVGAKVPASCQDEDEKSTGPSPQGEGLSAFSRGKGREMVGAAHEVYATRGQARRTIDAALSVHNIRCLARLLTSKHYNTSVHRQRASFTLAGRKFILNRLKVRTPRKGGHRPRIDYVDVVGVLHAKANALLIFTSAYRAPETDEELAAVSAVVRRLP
jgi:hypothetical protein